MSQKVEDEVGSIYLYADNDSSMIKSNIPFLDLFRRKCQQSKTIEYKRKALVKKCGSYRMRYTGLHGHRRKFVSDLYISLIDLKWRYALAFFFTTFLMCFLFFAVIWWLICYNHGDFEAHNIDNPDWNACISGVKNFDSCLLFAIETQGTIGYGAAYPNTDCDGGLLLLFLQMTLELLLENLLLGFIFVKFAQPQQRRNTLKFSKNACVSQEGGNLVLQIRVGDMRQSHLLNAKVHGVMVKRHITDEGFLYPLYLHNVKFQADAMDDKLVLMWPMVVTHKITEDSPFWDVKPADLSNEKNELIVYIEGTLETTGEFCQARTSYTLNEILWGHRFDRIEEFDSGNGVWEIDFAGFNDVVYYENIRHSAKELYAFLSGELNLSRRNVESEEPEMETKAQQKVLLKTIPNDYEPPELPIRQHKTFSKCDTTTFHERYPNTCSVYNTKEMKQKTCNQKSSFRTSVISADYHTADDEPSLEEEETVGETSSFSDKLDEISYVLIDLKWRYALAFFFTTFLMCFLFFAVIWWLICYNHGDFEAHNIDNPDWNACISGVKNFDSCLLFAIETQGTIGYGAAYPNTDCDGGLLLLFLQMTLELLLENLLLGFIFVKFAQPQQRRNTLKFSKNACVSQEGGNLVLQIRVGDMRQSHLLNAKVHGVMVKRHITDEGFLYPLYLHNVKFQADAMDDKLVLMWPMVVTHKITEDSPFWDVKPADLSNEKNELIVYIEGTLETTGEFCQARTSYTLNEILWGHRFDRIEEFDSGNGVWEIDFAGFNDVVYYENIRHSAKELYAFLSGELNLSRRNVESEEPEMETKAQQKVLLKTIPNDYEPPELPIRQHNTFSKCDTTTFHERYPNTCSVYNTKEMKQKTCNQKSSFRTSVISADYHTADDEPSLEEEETVGESSSFSDKPDEISYV
ncbi:hypothetical protein CHS0354_006721 [Potamilus streckersoni]|uniref:Uncharacterized protein n=1 Tax=Potamilus streckersoni TaxID=2493646 RepID=A0AAE0T5A5_9BIVA|nr:hypothetical protein CHS0354_006721 [Potamilus streckersoni]